MHRRRENGCDGKNACGIGEEEFGDEGESFKDGLIVRVVVNDVKDFLGKLVGLSWTMWEYIEEGGTS